MNEYDFLAKAKDKMDDKKYREVIHFCDEALKINKNLPEAYEFRGNAKYELEEYDTALEDFNELIKREPDDAQHYYDRSWIYHGLNDLENAIIDISKALEIEPKTSLFYYEKGRFEYWAERYKEAISDLTKGIELKPTENKYLIRGYCYLELGMNNEALADYNSAIEIDSEYAVAYYRRGLLYKNLDRLDIAEKDLKKAIELYPEYDVAMTELGFVRIQLGKKDSMTYFNKAIKVKPCDINYYLRVKARQKILIREDSLKKLAEGKLAEYKKDEIFNEKQAKDDIKDLSKAIALNDKDTDYYEMRADRYDYLDDYSKSIDDYDTLIDVDSDNGFYYWARACAKYNLKQYQNALEDIDKYLKLIGGTDDGYIFFIKGMSNFRLGNYDAAISDFTKGIFDGIEYDEKLQAITF